MLAARSWLPDPGNDVLVSILITSLFGLSRWGYLQNSSTKPRRTQGGRAGEKVTHNINVTGINVKDSGMSTIDWMRTDDSGEFPQTIKQLNN